MLFEQVIKMGSGFIAQPGGDLQNSQVGIGQQFSGMGELDDAPVRNNCGAHIVAELLLNIGIAIGDSSNKLCDLFVKIVGILHR